MCIASPSAAACPSVGCWFSELAL